MAPDDHQTTDRVGRLESKVEGMREGLLMRLSAIEGQVRALLASREPVPDEPYRAPTPTRPDNRPVVKFDDANQILDVAGWRMSYDFLKDFADQQRIDHEDGHMLAFSTIEYGHPYIVALRNRQDAMKIVDMAFPEGVDSEAEAAKDPS